MDVALELYKGQLATASLNIHLRAYELMNELRHLWPGVQEAVDLEGHDGSRVESQGARVLHEVG